MINNLDSRNWDSYILSVPSYWGVIKINTKTMIIKTYYLDRFIHDMSLDCPNFTRQGAGLIFDFYESIGEPVEYDPIAFRCEWTEYPDPFEALEDVGGLDEFESLEAFYLTLTYEGMTPAEALESVLGVAVLWDKYAPNSYVVGC